LDTTWTHLPFIGLLALLSITYVRS
jgi:hypothetical protein